MYPKDLIEYRKGAMVLERTGAEGDDPNVSAMEATPTADGRRTGL
jgi:hypothetical protein